MKLRKARIGEKFVFGKEGGVWEKLSDDRARCIWGPEKGDEVGIDGERYVYVIFEREKPCDRPESVPVASGSGVTIVIEDSEEVVLKRVEHAPASVVAAHSGVEALRFVPNGKREAMSFMVRETGFDYEKMEMHILVMED